MSVFKKRRLNAIDIICTESSINYLEENNLLGSQVIFLFIGNIPRKEQPEGTTRFGGKI
jgi:hypothetical protein